MISLTVLNSVAEGTSILILCVRPQAILNQSKDFLISKGFIALETNGEQQSNIVSQVMSDMGGFQDISAHRDYFGVQRFVTGYKI